VSGKADERRFKEVIVRNESWRIVEGVEPAASNSLFCRLHRQYPDPRRCGRGDARPFEVQTKELVERAVPR
jgi:hypothetical protein